MATNTLTSGQRLGLSTASEQSSFTLTAGRKAITLTGGKWTINDGTNTHTVIPLERFRGVKLGFGGSGADNSTANYRVWLVSLGFGGLEAANSPDYSSAIDAEVVQYIGDTSTVTLSTLNGVSGGLYTTSERIADTLTITSAGIGSSLETAYDLGVATAYSPTGNVPAKLIIPDLGRVHGFIVEFDLTGATAMNFDYELTL